MRADTHRLIPWPRAAAETQAESVWAFDHEMTYSACKIQACQAWDDAAQHPGLYYDDHNMAPVTQRVAADQRLKRAISLKLGGYRLASLVLSNQLRCAHDHCAQRIQKLCGAEGASNPIPCNLECSPSFARCSQEVAKSEGTFTQRMKRRDGKQWNVNGNEEDCC
uniref:Uncharacterized protein n=1 Tax=Eutreptiella gymnastica TaxID=73025 RepID=A0A7S4G7R2_9EUGL|mmetsp:Transcript_99939/g.168689  ORF Transcript_99939/g.168689 Transcript_99939/m.168689 type:complete len:165 (+) Transcript_99939:864-1358(+)|eukprot:CAMPEP_0174381058 /NCGR_PEP_ID=MMETSP0811_2-20130205/123769_1 /TAXON_ID=73025 ORGANISM="Eutreptiella gymnastica-like, Strain CCMP1594" /NCGR_SAMPLE_ID=MMETSP0811_2 /ASSEMBLY_ACC=CAM_ASM_000667 /LENGTH=164 /DNA_ID=CAMNT_0015534097 /DNA_START=839 /DNA_END=1333 /DNA_ORIENTATION=+